MAKTINLSQFDRDTGEEVSGFVAFVQPKRKSSFQRHFTMNQDALKILAKELNGEQTKVLLIMLGDLEYENYILIPQKADSGNSGNVKSQCKPICKSPD